MHSNSVLNSVCWANPSVKGKLHPLVATVCHIRFVTSGFVVSRDISPGYRTWDVFEGSEFFVFAVLTVLPNSSSMCLARFFGIVCFIVPLFWYVDIKDQLTEATVEELFGSQGEHCFVFALDFV